MKKRFVVGNWKMYITEPAEAKKFAAKLRRCMRGLHSVEVWIAPPFVLLPILQVSFKGSAIRLGAQTVSGQTEAAHTGEISSAMLKNVGASFVIVGHSERRALGENNESVHASLMQAIKSGLAVLLCIGEAERDQGGAYFNVLSEQLHSALKGFPVTYAHRLLVAYEPLWAIGKTAQQAIHPNDLQETQIFIRKILASILPRESARGIPILYGGSIEPSNAKELIEEGGVSGFLVGHASATINSFSEILSACKK